MKQALALSNWHL